MDEKQTGNEKNIGKVKIDYTYYSGQDYYSDGEVEDTLLKIVMEQYPVDHEDAFSKQPNWPVLYHLSPLRENILEWIPMGKDAKVLEVGSGCGAITGVLARKAGSVTCVELSKKRSQINAYRHRECGNVTIHVGNFKDVEPQLDRDYDYICLIGVFEYGQSYIGGDTPYEDFLRILMPHMKEGGRIVIAIENKYGLKYFAGCKEDHLGAYFSGIENYVDGGGVRTFSRSGLERIFLNCGLEKFHFYYPYPDYKFMNILFSDEHLPQKGELWDNLRNFDNDRMVLFNEKNAFDGLVADGLFPIFSNSFLAVIGEGFPVKYVKYSNDRAPEYSVRTEIIQEKNGGIHVRKYPLGEAAKGHVRDMEAAYLNLQEKYEGSGLEINKCRLVEQGNEVYARFEYVQGPSLLEKMDGFVEQGDLLGFQECFREYRKKISYNPDYPVSDFDLIFGNIIIQNNEWHLIDYEWTFGKQIPPEELAYRAINYYFVDDGKRSKFPLEWAMEELGITEQKAREIWKQEAEFQDMIRGKRSSMVQKRIRIGGLLMEPLDWLDKYKESQEVDRVQIYEDTGEGYSERQSYFVSGAYRGDHNIELKLSIQENVKALRIDPAMDSCMVKILEMTLNGERVPLEKRKVLLVNGRVIKPADKENGVYQPSIVFPTKDPNININLEGMKLQAENILCAHMEIVRLSVQMAMDMGGAVKRLI